MGGSDACYITDDTNIEEIIASVVEGAFFNAG